MADHLDAPGLMSPGGNVSTDITDIYAFQKPGDAAKSILILNANPLALAPAFDPDALYEILIDTDGDAMADIAYKISFSPFVGGAQSATVRRATGGLARQKTNTGAALFSGVPVSFGATAGISDADGYRFFAGKRSDPFFFDLLGFLAGFAFTGDDFFVDKNVFGIALEVPNAELGASPNIGMWARTLVPKQGHLHQIERMGRPAINTVFMKGKDKNGFNRAEPAEDPAQWTDRVVEVLMSFGHTLASAQAIAGVLLPDILTYNYSSSAGFLNGRRLQDDVIDAELSLVSNGAVTTDGAGVHTDLLSAFPYMGTPHP